MKKQCVGVPRQNVFNWAPEVHLNLNARGLAPSATVAINERSNKLLADGREIFKMGLGQSPFPIPQIVVDELKKNAHVKVFGSRDTSPCARLSVNIIETP